MSDDNKAAEHDEAADRAADNATLGELVMLVGNGVHAMVCLTGVSYVLIFSKPGSGAALHTNMGDAALTLMRELVSREPASRVEHGGHHGTPH